MKKIVLLSVILFLSSCIKLNKKQSNDAEVKREFVENKDNNLNILKDFNYEIDLENPGLVILTSPAEWGNQILIQQVQKEQVLDQRIVFSNQGKSNIQLSENIDSRIPVLFKFFKITEDVNSPNRSMSLLHQEYILPLVSLDLDRDTYLDDLFLFENLDKIYFSHLNLNGYKLFIKSFDKKIFVQNFESSSGSIQSYPEYNKAEPEKNGGKAGGFEISILNGKGFVSFNVFAQDGGNGKAGEPPDESLKGADGADGEPAQFIQIGSDSCGNDILNLCTGSVRYECIKPPGAGQNGLDGISGYPGTNAGNGGDVYKITINNRSAELTYKTYYKPGNKGLGGLGGLGGNGGIGGRGGDGGILDLLKTQNLSYDKYLNQKLNFNITKTCQPTKDGQLGHSGLIGRSGIDGKDGKMLDSIF